ncbi:sensor histidine kinase [Streptomyces afghaniensis]|uniref:sensor histidine kinase n=1 Tax=Streptomyces afghaniensis TaxID=66865 RepID=UPI0037D727AD
MSWTQKVRCRFEATRAAVRQAREHQRHYTANRTRLRAEWRAARRAGELPEHPGPPPSGFTLLPWLLLGMGALSNLFQDQTPNPWIGALGLLTFNSLYIYVAFRAFRRQTREARSTRVALALLAAVTCALAAGYGGNWLLFFPLLGLATGAALRLSHLRPAGTAVAALAGAVSCLHDGWGGLDIAYATWISTMVTAAIMRLSEAVRELRAAREELARRAVEKERLRFSRDLHDLLGHTMSVIVVKSEAARRLAARDLDAALDQITDIESVGRQALTEIREAVTGYRRGSLDTELDRAHSALTAAGIKLAVIRTGPPLGPQTEALLGWVVREAVTNVVRHSAARQCEITLSGAAERVRLSVVDDGVGVVSDGGEGAVAGGRGGAGGSDGGSGGSGARAGTGLTGLTERLAAAGGSLTAGPRARGGFAVAAELPLDGGRDAVRPAPACTLADGPRAPHVHVDAHVHVDGAGNG